ncbi:unnamed protein product [Arctogadus glacialis]
MNVATVVEGRSRRAGFLETRPVVARQVWREAVSRPPARPGPVSAPRAGGGVSRCRGGLTAGIHLLAPGSASADESQEGSALSW